MTQPWQVSPCKCDWSAVGSVQKGVPEPRRVRPSVSHSLGGQGSRVVREPTTAVISGLVLNTSCTQYALVSLHK